MLCDVLGCGDDGAVFVAVEVLWNLIENGSQLQVR